MVASYQIDDECTSAPIASEGRPFHNGNVCKFPLIIIIVMHFKCWREGSSSSTAWPDKVRKSIRFIFSNECNAQRVINSLWIIMPVTYGSINAPSRRGRSTFALFNLFSLSLSLSPTNLTNIARFCPDDRRWSLTLFALRW